MDYLSTKQTALQWGISQRRVSALCEQGRIKGANKIGKTWLVPRNSDKPQDGRKNKISEDTKLYQQVESRYQVIYPESNNATYTSLLNYSDDLEKPFQRWYRYKEGFSIDLVKQLIKEYAGCQGGVILDPFMGSGSTLVAANQLGYEGVGFEVNPFSYFLSDCKLNNYGKDIVDEFAGAYGEILEKSLQSREEYELPLLSISHKVFDKNIEAYYMAVKIHIDGCRLVHEEVRKLLKLGWLACLENLSNYRKAGNGLKKRKYVNPRIMTVQQAREMLMRQYQVMSQDLKSKEMDYHVRMINKSCLTMTKELRANSVRGIVFSPPYANCFDYTEIYKLELWFGDFVKQYSDLKRLRTQSLHSHLNGQLDERNTEKGKTNGVSESAVLNELLSHLGEKTLWDKRIPDMLYMYYADMFQVLRNCYELLDTNGFCSIIVGNSSYGGIIFPADLILAEYAENIGFHVDKIEVDRYIITSSQQYEITRDNSKYLRESVVCLVKRE